MTLLQQIIKELADDAGVLNKKQFHTRVTEEINIRFSESSPLHQLTLEEFMVSCDLEYISDNYLTIKVDNRARVKAALLEIGRITTPKEVAELSGVNRKSVGSYLSTLPSIVRAGKGRWGLSDWVDEPFEGIKPAITKRIEEAGGSIRENILLNELPVKFNISEASVNAAIYGPSFQVDHGWVSISTEPGSSGFQNISHPSTTNNDTPFITHYPVHSGIAIGTTLKGKLNMPKPEINQGN